MTAREDDVPFIAQQNTQVSSANSEQIGRASSVRPLVSSDEADPFADIDKDTEDADSDLDFMDTELSDLISQLQSIDFTANLFWFVTYQTNVSSEFSYWGYATKGGVTQDLLLAILHEFLVSISCQDSHGDCLVLSLYR